MAYYAIKWSSLVPTRNVVLTSRQAKLIERLVSSGRYQNASEVLREGLRLIEAKAEEDKARLLALRAAAQIGIEDVESGRYRDFDSFEALKKHLEDPSERSSRRARGD